MKQKIKFPEVQLNNLRRIEEKIQKDKKEIFLVFHENGILNAVEKSCMSATFFNFLSDNKRVIEVNLLQLLALLLYQDKNGFSRFVVSYLINLDGYIKVPVIDDFLVFIPEIME